MDVWFLFPNLKTKMKKAITKKKFRQKQASKKSQTEATCDEMREGPRAVGRSENPGVQAIMWWA